MCFNDSSIFTTIRKILTKDLNWKRQPIIYNRLMKNIGIKMCNKIIDVFGYSFKY